MSYMDIWAKPQQRQVRKTGNRELPNRVKDWPADAKRDFEYVKDQLWKWAKKDRSRDSRGLALIAYEAVRGEYEGRWATTITCDTEEEVWKTILSLK